LSADESSRHQGAISLRGISKNFGGSLAVKDVSFDVRPGEFFSLLGPSGCGKTTLLRILAGFETPTSGELLIDGLSMVRVPANRRPTNLVFQSYAIFPHLNVEQNVAYGLRRLGLSKAKVAARVDEALNRIKLRGYERRYAGQLSGGERQRVALARALICAPKVLLLDEPLGALDKKLREEMQLELRQLQRSVGITFVFVTHDQEEALVLSDRIAVMSKGQIMQIDEPSGIYDRPQNRQVAEFIGTMNFIPGVAGTSVNGLLSIASPAGDIIVHCPADCPPAGTQITVAIRPEKIRIVALGDSKDTNLLCGNLLSQAYYGDRNHIQVEVAGLDRPVAVSSQNYLRERMADGGGGEVVLTWAPSAALILPAS
jgi:spermidine/putrescine ABC transporter ATP-binding subunit